MINLEKIALHQKMMKEMQQQHGEIYFELFGRIQLEGMDIETAIHYCWNKLMTEIKNG